MFSFSNLCREWTANIGAPAALVAGAVLVTLSETREDSAPRKNDTPFIRRAKLALRMLLLSSFALEVISISKSDAGGLKEVIASVKGKNIYSTLKYESGVHRVQRVPETETQGRPTRRFGP